MALREDYYTPCVDEIKRKMRAIDELKDEVKESNYDDEVGLDNSNYSEEVEDEITKIIATLEDIQEMLTREQAKLADSISDVGWF